MRERGTNRSRRLTASRRMRLVAGTNGGAARWEHGMDEIARLGRIIDQGRGRAPADLVLKGGRIFDLVTGDLTVGDVALCGDRIVGTGGEYQGRRSLDARGKIIVPGFIDTHLHVESSLVTPGEFENEVGAASPDTAVADTADQDAVLIKR